jgi:hypothetical protein
LVWTADDCFDCQFGVDSSQLVSSVCGTERRVEQKSLGYLEGYSGKSRINVATIDTHKIPSQLL